MSFFLIVFLGSILFTALRVGWSLFRDHSMLSWASRDILNDYNRLSYKDQPFHDMKETLKSMDKNLGSYSVDGHFTMKYEHHGMSWEDNFCRHHDCEYKPYVDLHREVGNLLKAHEHREKLVRKSGVQVEDKILALQREAEITYEVTKEMI